MDNHIKQLITKEMELFHCSLLLEEVKEKIRKLKAYGLKDAEILNNVGGEELLPQLIVTEDYKIVLASGTEIEVKMEPLVKSVYLLFLSHPEGIVLKHLTDYRKEISEIYRILRPYAFSNKVQKSIIDVTDPTQNSINEKCARIRKLFSTLLPVHIAWNYFISGKRGEVRKINLPREKVKWYCKKPFSNGI